MKFLFPEILWGLLAIAVPILVHLFNFRKFKKVLFSNVEMLKDIKQETKSKSKLKHLLILLSRILAITCIVFAFAQPYIPVGEQESSLDANAVSIYIDNSFSMESENEKGRLLDLAKNKALEILEIYNSTDQFQVLNNDFESRHQRLVSREEAVELIEEIKLSPNSKMLNEVISRQRDLLIQEDDSQLMSYVVSDWQKSTHNFEEIDSDSSLTIRLVPNETVEVANCLIDSVWFNTPVRQLNQIEHLGIRLSNPSGKPVKDLPVKLQINGQQKAVATFDLDADSKLDTTLTYTHTTSGLNSAVVQINDYPVEYDNNMYFTYRVADKIKVAEIRGSTVSGTEVAKIFAEDPHFEYSSYPEGNIDYQELASADFVVVNQLNKLSTGLQSELVKFVAQGGTAFLVPSMNIDVTSYSAFTAMVNAPRFNPRQGNPGEVNVLSQEHPLYKDVFESVPRNINLPTYTSSYGIQPNQLSNSKTLLKNRDGSSFLTESKHENGSLYLSTVSLDASQSNFAQHALFVTSLIRMAEFAVNQETLEYEIGGRDQISIKASPEQSEELLKMRAENGDGEFLPGTRKSNGRLDLFVEDQVTQAGIYSLNQGNAEIGRLAFNYSRTESLLEAYEEDELRNTLEQRNLQQFQILNADLESMSAQAAELTEGKKLWRIFIILSLLFLAMEVLLIKFWK